MKNPTIPQKVCPKSQWRIQGALWIHVPLLDPMSFIFSGGSRISQTRGANPRVSGKTCYLTRFCQNYMKMKEIGPRVGHSSIALPLDPSMIFMPFSATFLPNNKLFAPSSGVGTPHCGTVENPSSATENLRK